MKDYTRFPSKYHRWKTSNKFTINLSLSGHHCNPKQTSQKNRENHPKIKLMSKYQKSNGKKSYLNCELCVHEKLTKNRKSIVIRNHAVLPKKFTRK
jgi:hypothetical protein